MMSAHYRAWNRCPIRFNPFDGAIRYLVPPRHLASSPVSIALKMAAAAATSSQSQPGPSPKRPVCQVCSKPARTCLCGRIHSPGLDNSIGLTVLQHGLEKKHPLNSIRIVKLGFKNVTVAAVSDVHFNARFSVRLLGKESCEVDCTDSSQKMGTENPRNHRKRSGSESEMLVDCLEAKNLYVVEDGGGSRAQDSGFLPDRREPVIEIFIGKKGVISFIEHTLETDIHHPRQDSGDILESGVARDVFSKGFLVRKLQRSKVNPSLEPEECEEFELIVPPGSVLLFPTEEALSIDELRASDFEVKNLIVLDGTWLKARRMYSENPWLRLLPHLKLDTQVMSLYGEVRSQPKAGCLSTLESIVYTLKALGDGSPGSLDNLLEVFGSMVNDQRLCKLERLNIASTVELKLAAVCYGVLDGRLISGMRKVKIILARVERKSKEDKWP